jgi:flagellar basal-body rod protein FlgC
MSISALNSGLSGMQAFQRALDSSSNNVANLQTNGFEPQQADFQENTGGGVKVTLSTPAASQGDSSASAPSGTDFTAEAVNSVQDQLGFELSAQVVKTADQTLGTLINIKA